MPRLSTKLATGLNGMLLPLLFWIFVAQGGSNRMNLGMMKSLSIMAQVSEEAALNYFAGHGCMLRSCPRQGT